MTGIAHIKHGISVLRFQRRTATIVYAIQMIIALTFGFQVYKVMDASIGDSLELSKLLVGFDHTIISDFINIHGASISPLLGQLRWVLLLFILISAFVNGGLFYCVWRGQMGWTSFWYGCATHFWSFLKVAIAFTCIHVIWFCICWLPMLSWFNTAVQQLPSEKTYFMILLVVAGLYVFGLGFVILINTLCKLLILDARKLRYALKESFQKLKSRFGLLVFVFTFWVMAILLLVGAYRWLSCLFTQANNLVIISMILIQQLVVFLKVLMRFGLVGSVAKVLTIEVN